MAQSIHIRSEVHKYINREIDEAKYELKQWGWWNKNHKYNGAPNPNPPSLSGKIFIVTGGELVVPPDVNKTARVIELLPDAVKTVLWLHYVLNKYQPKNALHKSRNYYLRYKDELEPEPLNGSIYY